MRNNFNMQKYMADETLPHVPSAKYECDLHCHTTRSDGADTPEELIINAKMAGLTVLAVTDHDVTPPEKVSVASGEEMDICEYASGHGILLLRGIEISCETEVEDVHIVCFGCEWKDGFFAELEKNVKESKVNGYKELAERLRRCGMDVSWQEILENGGRPVDEEHVQKKMIFELMAKKGYAPDWSTAKLMVKNDARLLVKRKKPDPVRVINEIHRCGGICILAHPFLISDEVNLCGDITDRRSYIERLIGTGIDGIEACYPYSRTSYGGRLSDGEIENYIRREYSERLEIISGGSDYHADHKKGVKDTRTLGECGITYEEFQNNRILQNFIV